MHQHVVDAHADQVDADRVVTVQRLRQLQLGAHAVGAGHQHRFLVASAQVEQAAEAAQSTHHFGAQGALDHRLDAFDQRIAGIDIDAGGAVGEGVRHGENRGG